MTNSVFQANEVLITYKLEQKDPNSFNCKAVGRADHPHCIGEISALISLIAINVELRFTNKAKNAKQHKMELICIKMTLF
jgi:hypothetical protein